MYAANAAADNTGIADAAFANQGTVIRDNAASGSVYFDVPLQQSGTMTITKGYVQARNGGTLAGAIAGADPNFSLLLSSGTFTLVGDVTGSGLLRLDAATLLVNDDHAVSSRFLMNGGLISGSAKLTLGGAFSWQGGSMSGVGTTKISSTGVATLAGALSLTDGRTLSNEGQLAIGSGGLSLASSCTILNSGVFDLRYDGAWSLAAAASGLWTFINTGILRKSAGGGDFLFNGVAFSNSGSTQIHSGRVLINGEVLP